MNCPFDRSRRTFLGRTAGSVASVLLIPQAAPQAQGLDPGGLPVSGVSQPELADLDGLMTLFMQDQRVPVAGAAKEAVPLPYGTWSLEAMDANGGWLASAADLVRFASAFDDPVASPVLGPESIARMFARPAGEVGREVDGHYYGCGWWVRPAAPGNRAETSHSGQLPGTPRISCAGTMAQTGLRCSTRCAVLTAGR